MMTLKFEFRLYSSEFVSFYSPSNIAFNFSHIITQTLLTRLVNTELIQCIDFRLNLRRNMSQVAK